MTKVCTFIVSKHGLETKYTDRNWLIHEKTALLFLIKTAMYRVLHEVMKMLSGHILQVKIKIGRPVNAFFLKFWLVNDLAQI